MSEGFGPLLDVNFVLLRASASALLLCATGVSNFRPYARVFIFFFCAPPSLVCFLYYDSFLQMTWVSSDNSTAETDYRYILELIAVHPRTRRFRTIAYTDAPVAAFAGYIYTDTF